MKVVMEVVVAMLLYVMDIKIQITFILIWVMERTTMVIFIWMILHLLLSLTHMVNQQLLAYRLKLLIMMKMFIIP